MTASGRTPREDKDRDYRRQSTSPSSNGFRKHWPKRKAVVHRSYRRAQSTLLAAQAGSPADTLADHHVADRIEARIAATRRGREPNWNNYPLSYAVTGKLVARFLDMLDTFARAPYRPETQRERTERALTEIVRPRPAAPYDVGGLRRTAYALDGVLPRPVFGGRDWKPERAEARREWFTAFLDDAPGWEPRLIAWVIDHAHY
jgi:hypothetical protein